MNFMYYMDKGGIIMYILLFLSIIGITILMWKFLILRNTQKNIDKISQNIVSDVDLKNNKFMIEILKDDILIFILKIEKGMETVKTISTIAPLLGLLGTVIGILNSFEKIASMGMDSSFFAAGISLALITTIGGLIVAIPNTIGYNYLLKMLDFIELNINKKTMEIVYEQNHEKKK